MIEKKKKTHTSSKVKQTAPKLFPQFDLLGISHILYLGIDLFCINI